jgi:uncharacterized protein (DUF1501 family)
MALCMGLSAPLLLRGPARVEAWAPEHFGQDPSDDLYARIEALADHDPLIGPALREGLRLRGAVPLGGVAAAAVPGDAMGPAPAPGAPPKQRAEVILAATAARMLAAPVGPRVAVLEVNGWDTHADQARRLKLQLALLDAMFAELRAGLGETWRQTAILAVTEFGRTARVNGTGGTDHGTGGVAFLAGGAVAGGRVRADWPGLASGRLFENRDLMPTTDLRCIAKGLLSSHLGLGAAGLAQAFPGSGDAAPASGLIRA